MAVAPASPPRSHAAALSYSSPLRSEVVDKRARTVVAQLVPSLHSAVTSRLRLPSGYRKTHFLPDSLSSST